MVFITVDELIENLPQIMSDLKESGAPVKISSSDGYSAYLVDAESYQLMLSRIEILEGVLKGEEAIRSGKVRSHSDIKNNH